MHRPARLLAAVACALLALGCPKKPDAVDAGPVDAGPPVLTEAEPNDSAAQALPIERTSLIEANLSADPAKPDEDWFVLKAAVPRTATIEVGCPPQGDVAVELVDETKTVLARVDAQGPGEKELVPNLDVSGKAFFRVVTAKKGSGGAYTVKVTLKDRVPGFELEPNDRKVDATAVPLGAAISGFVAHGNDVDWYRYELPQAEPPATLEAADAGDADAAVDGAADAGGEDAGVDAGAVDAGPPVEKRIALRVDVSALDGVALDVQILTEAEAVLLASKSSPSVGVSLRNLGARERDRVLYVVVKSAPLPAAKDSKEPPKRGFSTGTYYTLTVAPEDAQDGTELEPNDEADKATSLPANAYREGFISPKGDVDFYRLDVDTPSAVTVELGGLEAVDTVLSLLNPAKPDEVLLKVNEGGTKEPERLVNVGCEQSCLFRVEPTARKVDGKWVREDWNGDRPYRLTTTVTPQEGLEREPNDKAERAGPIAFGAPLRGLIYPKKDVDYFLLDLHERAVKTPLQAQLTGILKVDVALYLHRLEDDGKLTLVQTADTAKGDKPELLRASVEPGRYVFEVRDLKGREANFQDSYMLTVDEGE